MAAPDVITNVWNWNNPKYSKPQPSDRQLNPDAYKKQPIIQTQLFSDGNMKKIKYCNSIKGRPVSFRGGKCNIRKCEKIMRNKKFNEYMEKSKFFSDVDDDEKTEHRNITKITEKNPEFILSKINRKQADDIVNNINSINKRVMTDTGLGAFEYDPPDSDQVDIVRQSNINYVRRKNRYFIRDSAAGTTGGENMLQLIKQSLNKK